MAVDRRSFLSQASLSLLGVYTLGIRRLAASQKRTLTVAAAGDCIITRKLSALTGERFLKLVNVFRDSDVGFGNCEMTLHNFEGYPAPSGGCGDLNLVTEPAIADELAWAGFNMMALANNHTGDYGTGGLLASIKNLNQAGIVPAGAGANLHQARAPRYRDGASGRVALVACASTYRRGTAASPSHAAVPGRPGLSPLRVSRAYQIRREQLQSIREIREDMKEHVPGFRTTEDESGRVDFLGNVFEEASEPGVVIEADQQDMEEILAGVRRARVEADLVLVSIHAHESGANREEPAAFLPVFARACVDAGADMFIGHGPHVLRGIEIYKGKPIFYSLGNFLFQAETIQQIPAEIYKTCEIPSLAPSDFFAKVMGRMFERPIFWESAVPRVRFDDGKCSAIDIYPIDLRWKLPSTQRGTPELADLETSNAILERLAELSRPFGTKLTQAEGVGAVVL
jgi:poly-gamma-glutamate synthesis protein (capsule biosynthesis protein)